MSELPVGGNAAEQLRSFVERVEFLMEERKGISDDIRDVLSEAKATGYDTKVIRRVIRERAKDTQTRQEEQAVFDTYATALGLVMS